MPLSQVKNRELRKIIDRATQKDCNKRYQTAAEFRAALDNVGTGSGGSAVGGFLSDHAKLIGGIAAALIVALIVVVVVVTSGGKEEPAATAETEAGTPAAVSQPAGGGLTIKEVREELLNAGKAKKGFEDLKTLAGQKDSRDAVNAKYFLSRLYAVPTGSFSLDNDYAVMQANLKDVVKQDPARAHAILKEVVADVPEYFPALYDLGCDYYEGPAMTGGEPRDLVKAKEYFDKAYDCAQKAEDPAYISKINAMLRKY